MLDRLKPCLLWKNMSLTKIVPFCFFLTAFSVAIIPNSSVNAQQSQSFTKCVSTLGEKINYYTAIEQCKGVFRGQPLSDDFQTCTNVLGEKINYYTAIEHCKEVLKNAAKPVDNNPNQGTTIIINPGQNQPQQPQQRQYTERRVCISPVGTQVYSTRACELGVSGFTWKTTYE